jgi:hypothetical protein
MEEFLVSAFKPNLEDYPWLKINWSHLVRIIVSSRHAIDVLVLAVNFSD